MPMNIKKKLQFAFKYLSYQTLSIINGKIKGIVKPSNDPRITIKKVNLSENLFYNIYSVNTGRLYTDTISDTAFILENKIIEGPSFQLRNVKNVKCEENIVFKKGTPRFRKKLQGNVFSLLTGGAGNSNYWHWLFDVLPRLEILNKKENYKKMDYFLFPSLEEKFQNETLNILDINKNKRLSSKIYRHISANNITAVDHPYVLNNNPSIEIQNIPSWISKWLKNIFLKKLETNKIFPKKIYIDRRDAKSNHKHLRKIINEKEIIALLKENNFKIISLSELTFIDQVSLFNNIEQVVGLHGAGFANIVFCKPGTKVLELKSNTAGDVIKNLAKTNNLDYSSISITSDFEIKNQQGLINIPLDKLGEKINK